MRLTRFPLMSALLSCTLFLPAVPSEAPAAAPEGAPETASRPPSLAAARASRALPQLVPLEAVTSGRAQALESRLMVKRINSFRSAHGLPPFRPSSRLARSADRYSRHLMRRDRFGHGSRIQAGPGFRSLGEVLEIHFGHRARLAGALRGWARSPGHRALLLSRSFRYAGAGRTSGTFGGQRMTIWVAHFGRR